MSGYAADALGFYTLAASVGGIMITLGLLWHWATARAVRRLELDDNVAGLARACASVLAGLGTLLTALSVVGLMGS
jgi:hypothetical protein